MNVDEMHKELSRKAKREPEHQFENLCDLLWHDQWLRAAWGKVSTNTGSETAGVDHESMTTFNEPPDKKLAELKEQLKAKTFEPRPVRRVYIPKANGKKRPLGIPTIADRIVQEALRMILEPIWEADFSTHSYGFRPNRNAQDALTYLTNRLTGRSGKVYQWVIEGDITSYFDEIPHRRLIKAVKKRVADRDIRDLLWKFLRAGVMEKGKQRETLTGTPQGGIVSPLLANIYLHELDRYMESNYLNLDSHARARRRKQGEGNFLYVRYADDFVVLCNGTKAEAQKMKEALGGILSNMGLELSEEKTKITHITAGITFLGYRIKRHIGTTGKMVPMVSIPEAAMKRFRHKTRGIIAPSTLNDSVKAKVVALNRLGSGWCQYDRITHAPTKTFRKLNPAVYWGLAHWLGRKYKISMPEVMKRFQQEKGGLGTKSITVRMPTEYTLKKSIPKTWHNPYTGKGKITREEVFSYDDLWTGHEDRQGWMDLREEVILLKGTTCSLWGTILHSSEVEVDHIIPRARFKDPQEADSMDNLQTLCTPCHRAKTKTDLKVLSRMR